jgi:CRISPR/Cas system CSM-associated protein Csm2 small subunit
MKKIFYEKVGGRYKPVYEYDQTLMDAFPKGTHIVMCYPGGQSRRYNVDPNYAAMIAAGRVAEDAVSKKIMEATEIRRNYKMPKELTPGQKAAWENLVKEFGDDAKQLEWPSAREAAEEAVKAMQEEADKLMQHPSAKKAFERFVTVCALTRDHTVNVD